MTYLIKVLLIPCLLVANTSYARVVNHDLSEQFSSDGNRQIPQSDLYTVGGDLNFFWNIDHSKEDYYHSGYLLNVYGELRPLERFAINVKLIATDPSNSYGYAGGTAFLPLLSAAYDQTLWDQFKVYGIAFDLDRQTLGTGLLIAEKEMSGMLGGVKYGDFSAQIVKPGTGVYDYRGDADYADLNWLDGVLGVYVFRLTMDGSSSKTEKTEAGEVIAIKDQAWHQYQGLYSKHQFDSGFHYAVEGTKRNSSTGDLSRIGFKNSFDQLNTTIDLERRHYREGLFESIAGRIEQDYQSLEDRDKEYTNPMNIFTTRSYVTTTMGIVNVEAFPTSPFRFTSRNEFGEWSSNFNAHEKIYAFDHKALYCPYAPRDTCIDLAYSNILSNAHRSVGEVSTANIPTVKLLRHWRLEATILF